MGVIYNNKVEESKIYQAYGLTVYGKINSWTFCNETENVLITFRITDINGNDIFFMDMGNRHIFQSRIDDTLDNFLWWIVEDKPDGYIIENQVYKTLCESNSLFNYRIQQRKRKQEEYQENKRKQQEYEIKEKADKEIICNYCMKNGMIVWFDDYGKVYIIKPCDEISGDILKSADTNKMKKYVDFIKHYPENTSAFIIKDGNIEEIIKYIGRKE